jgi:carbonic anhydrase/acetyltransferase-like protein (isoleucine patch superfamily)
MPIYAHKGVVPRLGKDVYVAPNATIIGDVVIGEQSSVWFGVVIRGDVFPIRIGARTNLQDNAVVHVTNGKAATTIGDDVTVGHLALIHGCTIGSRCLIGMGSIVLDNAIVEDDCFVAAGALVPPGVRIPARSLVVGRPAKRVRTLEDADLAEIKSAGALYVQYARDFSTDVHPI